MQNAKDQPVLDDYDLDLGMLAVVDRSLGESTSSKPRRTIHAAWLLPLALARFAASLSAFSWCDWLA